MSDSENDVIDTTPVGRLVIQSKSLKANLEVHGLQITKTIDDGNCGPAALLTSEVFKRVSEVNNITTIARVREAMRAVMIRYESDIRKQISEAEYTEYWDRCGNTRWIKGFHLKLMAVYIGVPIVAISYYCAFYSPEPFTKGIDRVVIKIEEVDPSRQVIIAHDGKNVSDVGSHFWGVLRKLNTLHSDPVTVPILVGNLQCQLPQNRKYFKQPVSMLHWISLVFFEDTTSVITFLHKTSKLPEFMDSMEEDEDVPTNDMKAPDRRLVLCEESKSLAMRKKRFPMLFRLLFKKTQLALIAELLDEHSTKSPFPMFIIMHVTFITYDNDDHDSEEDEPCSAMGNYNSSFVFPPNSLSPTFAKFLMRNCDTTIAKHMACRSLQNFIAHVFQQASLIDNFPFKSVAKPSCPVLIQKDSIVLRLNIIEIN